MKRERFLPLLWLYESLGVEEVYLPEGSVDKARALALLKEKVLSCTKCPLHKTNTHYVFGSGNPYADVVLVGEAPGEEEDKRGKPFVGRAGVLLTELLTSVGFSREKDTYIVNVLKCRPPGNRNPKLEEIQACGPYLEAQIQMIRPKILFALGRYAVYFLLRSEAPLSRLRGTLHETPFNIPLLVTYHPAALLRNPMYTDAAREDFRRLREFLSK